MQETDLITSILAHFDIVQVAQSYGIVLKQESSGGFVGCCPFHEERHPSFHINPATKKYKCFSCGESGDVINLLSFMKGLPLRDTIKFLAVEAGLSTAERQTSERERYIEACRAAVDYYRCVLHGTPNPANSYLQARGIRPESVAAFQIGYSDKNRGLLDALKKAGVNLHKALEWGLLRKSQRTQNLYDPFWGRLIFPIVSSFQVPIAFGGRLIEENTKGANAKYINSTSNSFYQKGNELYALSQALPSIRKKKKAVLVEGYIDAVSMHQANHTNTVATLGTAITIEQLALLSRYTSCVVFIGDGDAAGLTAIHQGIRRALILGLQSQVVLLPQDTDPDTCVQSSDGKAWLASKIDDPLDGLEYYLDYLLSAAGGAMFASWVRELLADTPDDLIRCFLLKRIANFLGVPVKEVGVEMPVLENTS